MILHLQTPHRILERTDENFKTKYHVFLKEKSHCGTNGKDPWCLFRYLIIIDVNRGSYCFARFANIDF